MTETAFDWEAVELEEKKRKRSLTKQDYLKLGFTSDQIDAYETSFDRINPTIQQNDLLKGKVLYLTEENAVIDVNTTEDAYLDLSKEDKRYLDYIQPGYEVTVQIISNPDEKGYLNASFTAAAKETKKQEILSSIGEGVAYLGYVKELVSGGYVVILDDVEAFMPGSLAGINKLHDFNVLLGKEILVKPVNFERGNIVVSHREYLRALIPNEIEKLKESMDKQVTGFVTGTTKYGVFCEFNECLTGMILISDLTEDWQEKHQNREIKPGDSIDFYVKEIVSTKKIILTQTIKYDPWSDIETRYKVPCEVDGVVTAVREYGAFIQIVGDEIVGLLHQSEFADREFEENQQVKVNITRIDKSTKKVFMTLPK